VRPSRTANRQSTIYNRLQHCIANRQSTVDDLRKHRLRRTWCSRAGCCEEKHRCTSTFMRRLLRG